jgi:peptide/nickel transport system substrate-binding protein
VTAIEQGRADWLAANVPVTQFDQLELQHPALLHLNPIVTVDFVHLNTNVAPFNDVRVRQALNDAIDRAEIVKLYGGPSFATPTCQLIMPGLPGYRPYCPYTIRPSDNGAWLGPDMTLARRLVAQSDTYVRARIIPPGATQAFYPPLQLDTVGSVVPLYPYPSSYIPLFTSCNGPQSNGWYCNPAVDREMQEAELFEISDPGKASTLWAAIDRQLTDAAVWVPTVNERDVEITSSRLGNYEYSPIEGFLADQAWVK